jgi:hypothetical protein
MLPGWKCPLAMYLVACFTVISRRFLVSQSIVQGNLFNVRLELEGPLLNKMGEDRGGVVFVYDGFHSLDISVGVRCDWYPTPASSDTTRRGQIVPDA